MQTKTRKWQLRMVKNSIDKYREAVENYYIKGKQIIDTENGYKAFSLLSPPIASPVAKRRIRLIMENILEQETRKSKNNAIPSQGRTPHFVTMAVSYQCQCDCSHCSASTYQKQTLRAGNALKFEELENAVKETIALGTTSIVFTGGEPLLFERIFDLIKTVDKSKAVCTIFTNGEYLDSEAVRKLKLAGTFGVFVSFDSTDEKKHEENRKRKGIFKKAARGIKLCQEAGILTGISTFITREKLVNGEMDAMLEFARELNVLEVFIFDVIPAGKLENKQECLLSEPDFKMIRTLREKYNLKPDYPRIIHQTMLTSIAYPCTGEGCPAGVAHFHLRANGDVSPCDFTPFSFGNIRKNSLRNIWGDITNSDIYAKPSPRCRLSDPDFWKNKGVK